MFSMGRHVHYSLCSHILLVQVINEVEALMHHKLDHLGSENAVEVVRSRDLNAIHRTTNRISLTCRLVLKVHKNLFRF